MPSSACCGSPPPPEATWARSLKSAEEWLQLFASLWLDRAPLYNAAKHGFGLHAGSGAFTLGGTDLTPPILDFSGPVVTYLDLQQDNGTRRRWTEVMAFVDVELNFTYTYQAIEMIRGLWSIAAFRYTQKRPQMIRLYDTSVTDVMTAHAQAQGSPYMASQLNMPLAYYEEDPNPDKEP